MTARLQELTTKHDRGVRLPFSEQAELVMALAEERSKRHKLLEIIHRHLRWCGPQRDFAARLDRIEKLLLEPTQ